MIPVVSVIAWSLIVLCFGVLPVIIGIYWLEDVLWSGNDEDD